MPGLFITSSAFRIFSSSCCLLQNQFLIPAIRYDNFLSKNFRRKQILHIPCCFASIAAPTPLSPPPSMTILLLIILNSMYKIGFSIGSNIPAPLKSSELLQMSLIGVSGLIVGFSINSFIICHYRFTYLNFNVTILNTTHNTVTIQNLSQSYFMISQLLVMMMQRTH